MQYGNFDNLIEVVSPQVLRNSKKKNEIYIENQGAGRADTKSRIHKKKLSMRGCIF